MAGIPTHPRDRALVRDVKTLKGRGLSMQEIATKLGMSRATLYRCLAEAEKRSTR